MKEIEVSEVIAKKIGGVISERESKVLSEAIVLATVNLAITSNPPNGCQRVIGLYVKDGKLVILYNDET